MRTITKGTEPSCLSETRRHATTSNDYDWSNLVSGCSAQIRDLLLTEQGHTCVYCGRRIKQGAPSNSNPSGTTIEHWLAREHHPTQMFDWSNLFGVCSGESVFEGERTRHCDTARGSSPLHVHPTSTNIDARLHVVRSSGELRPVSDLDTELREDIETLCLNTPRLMANRRAVMKVLGQRLSRNDSPGAIQRMWDATKPDSSGRLEEYAFVARIYLRKKARQKRVTLA